MQLRLCTPHQFQVTNKVCRIIRTLCTLISGNLRIGTERARAIYLAVSVARRLDLIRRFAFSTHCSHGAKQSKLDVAVTASAMRHSRHHEQTVKLLHVTAAAISATTDCNKADCLP